MVGVDGGSRESLPGGENVVFSRLSDGAKPRMLLLREKNVVCDYRLSLIGLSELQNHIRVTH